MKLGSQTGSVMNHLYSRMTNGAPEPVVGMGATLLAWSDRYAATIVGVEGNIIEVRQDKATVVKGSCHDGSAEYEYSPGEYGYTQFFRRAKDGSWAGVRKNPETGRWVKSNREGILIGQRREYRDPSF